MKRKSRAVKLRGRGGSKGVVKLVAAGPDGRGMAKGLVRGCDGVKQARDYCTNGLSVRKKVVEYFDKQSMGGFDGMVEVD